MCLADSTSPGRPLASLRSLKANISACCFRCKLPAERGGDHPSFLSSWGPHVWPPCRLCIGAGLLVPSDRSCKWQVICGAGARCSLPYISLTAAVSNNGYMQRWNTHTLTPVLCVYYLFEGWHIALDEHMRGSSRRNLNAKIIFVNKYSSSRWEIKIRNQSTSVVTPRTEKAIRSLCTRTWLAKSRLSLQEV